VESLHVSQACFDEPCNDATQPQQQVGLVTLRESESIAAAEIRAARTCYERCLDSQACGATHLTDIADRKASITPRPPSAGSVPVHACPRRLNSANDHCAVL